MPLPNETGEQLRKIQLSDFLMCKSLEEKITLTLRFAALAPSTHNIQPWKVIRQSESCTVLVDPTVVLPNTDPTRRCSFISVGCFLENLVLAAQVAGIFDKIEPGSGDEVAKVYFRAATTNAGEANKQLAEAITKRRNVRGPFSAPTLDSSVLQNMQHLVGAAHPADIAWVTDRAKVSRLAELTAEGMRRAHSQRSFRKELSGWIVNNFSKRLSGIPGYSMNMPNPISLIVPKMIGWFNMGGLLSKLNFMSVSSAPLVCVFSSTNDPQGWTAVGRAAERLMLAAAAHGMTSSVYVASIEMDELYKDVAEVASCPQRPQFLVCVGPMAKYPNWFTQRKNVV